jgi:hypothetical protein
MTESSQDDVTVWNYVELHIRQNYATDARANKEMVWGNIAPTRTVKKAVAAKHALSSLLQMMVRLTDAPPEFVRTLQPQDRQVVVQGGKLRDYHRALIVEHAPLPTVLQNIVIEYAEPINGRDVCAWTDEKGISNGRKNSGTVVKKGSLARMMSAIFSCGGSATM